MQEASDYAIRENGAVIPGQIGETKGDVTTIMEIGEEDRTSHGRRTFDQDSRVSATSVLARMEASR